MTQAVLILVKSRKQELAAASYELYESTVNRLVDYFGPNYPIIDITIEQAQNFILTQKKISEGHIGESISDWTRDQIRRHCRTIFDAAVEYEYIYKNPFKAKILRGKKLRIRDCYWVKAPEYHKLIQATPSLRDKVSYSLFYTAGLRLNEAFNLTWDCIDFENNLIYIKNRQSTEEIPPFRIKDHEIRKIPIPQHTINFLIKLQ